MDHLDNSSALHNIKLRERFVQNLEGTTMHEIMLILFQVPLYAFFPVFIELCFLDKFKINVYKVNQPSFFSASIIFLLEASTIVIPLVLMYTVLADYAHFVCIAIIAVTYMIIVRSVSLPNESVYYWKIPSHPYFKNNMSSETAATGKQAFITYFRSFTFLITAICILGVDFHVFPRRYAKTETYGVSLMDMGVGLFVMSNGLVIKTASFLNQQISKILWECFIFLAIGTVRYFLIQRLNYQKHITEYGIHWNFFITLAMVKLLAYLLLKISRGHSFISGLLVMIIHQYLLSYSLESYVLSNKDRDNWFDANREGIISLFGYLSLYLISISIANAVNSVNKQFSIRIKTKTILSLVFISSIMFVTLYYLKSIDFKVSRRLANLPFVMWITAVSLSILALTLIVEMLALYFLPIQQKIKSPIYLLITPAILESINNNGLLFFIVSNILTGVINLYIDVLNLEALKSITLLSVYMLVNCAVVFQLHLSNIKVKL
uniref:Phosphatidylinositol-glycan biosynthesis class W protein n=1 Tax=Cuerna arida TaxID=1464854 RepID=A0A1B6FED9_9HEMI